MEFLLWSYLKLITFWKCWDKVSQGNHSLHLLKNETLLKKDLTMPEDQPLISVLAGSLIMLTCWDSGIVEGISIHDRSFPMTSSNIVAW